MLYIMYSQWETKCKILDSSSCTFYIIYHIYIYIYLPSSLYCLYITILYCIALQLYCTCICICMCFCICICIVFVFVCVLYCILLFDPPTGLKPPGIVPFSPKWHHLSPAAQVHARQALTALTTPAARGRSPWRKRFGHTWGSEPGFCPESKWLMKKSFILFIDGISIVHTYISIDKYHQREAGHPQADFQTLQLRHWDLSTSVARCMISIDINCPSSKAMLARNRLIGGTYP